VDADSRTIRTSDGAELHYDVLVVACGAHHVEGVPGAITFPSPGDVEDIRAVLDDLEAGRVRRLSFALPAGGSWPLPLYELALMTARELEKRGIEGVELTLVTPESGPLGLFGDAASAEVRRLLEELGIEMLTRTYPVSAGTDGLVIHPGELLETDRVIALSRLEGPCIDGVPRDPNGFIPVDPYGRVAGLENVYAAGDAVAFPIKQGGIAAQQAVAVAGAIAAEAGAPVRPQPFRPVLRGLLLTGEVPHYLRSELTGGYGSHASSLASVEPLWWPPSKIAGGHVAHALAEIVGERLPELEDGTELAGVRVEVELG
jgi:sulfide:quinone oxidoreductase